MWVRREPYTSYPRAARPRRPRLGSGHSQGGMGPLGVVEVDPVADDPFGNEAVAQVVFLRYPAEYTLNTCPIFWDHLIVRRPRPDFGLMLIVQIDFEASDHRLHHKCSARAWPVTDDMYSLHDRNPALKCMQ